MAFFECIKEFMIAKSIINPKERLHFISLLCRWELRDVEELQNLDDRERVDYLR